MNSISLKASAGSGKTYNLALRFIKLIADINKNLENCASSITAITFTNKAAEEMRRRIIDFLKNASIYSNLPQNESLIKKLNINPEEAFFFLAGIIKDYKNFNVITIDSFINKIARTLAVELNINPDYEIYFESEKIFKTAVNDILGEKSNYGLLLDFIKSSISMDKKGFNPQEIIKSSLYEFKDIKVEENVIGIDFLLDYFSRKYGKQIKSYGEAKKVIGNDLSETAGQLKSVLESNAGYFNAAKSNFLKKINLDNITKNKTDEKLLDIINNGAVNILKKNKKSNENLNGEVAGLTIKLLDLFKHWVSLKYVFESYSVSRILNIFKEKQEKIKSYLNLADGNDIAERLSVLLKDESKISLAFCNLGEKISHYLIDEFQDTSMEHFETMKYLIENALSQNGSLFVVGDKKQSIYGWRGGDYEIFDLDGCSFKNYLINEYLKDNYRSAKKIVNFNNVFFAKNRLSDLIDKLIGGRPVYDETFYHRLKSGASNVYENSAQNALSDEDGYIEIAFKDCKDAGAIDTFVREELKAGLEKLLNNGIIPKDIMILVRYKKNIEKIIGWLNEDFKDVNFITREAGLFSKNYEIKKFLLVLRALAFDDPSYESMLNEAGADVEAFKNIKEQSLAMPLYELFCCIIDSGIFDLDANGVFFEKVLDITLDLIYKEKGLAEIIDYLEKEAELGAELDNIDAVKIMTIHKSKGLESHSVIIPFYDWALYSEEPLNKRDHYGLINLKGVLNFEENRKAFVKIKSFRSINDEAKESYYSGLEKTFIENLNLMYVANTRARKNLFIIAPCYYNKGRSEGEKVQPQKLPCSNFALESIRLLKKAEEDMNNESRGGGFAYKYIDGEVVKSEYSTQGKDLETPEAGGHINIFKISKNKP